MKNNKVPEITKKQILPEEYKLSEFLPIQPD